MAMLTLPRHMRCMEVRLNICIHQVLHSLGRFLLHLGSGKELHGQLPLKHFCTDTIRTKCNLPVVQAARCW